jgi:hypothetical protein
LIFSGGQSATTNVTIIYSYDLLYRLSAIEDHTGQHTAASFQECS